MAYQKQNFTDGQVLTAENLNHIEDGIATVEEQVDAKLTNYYTSGQVDEKIEEATSSSGGGGGYDENNKLPAEYIEGLPDMSLYATLAELAQKFDELKLLTTPLYFKYVSFEAPDDEFTEICEYNKARFKEYLQSGIYVRPVFLWVTQTDAYYPLYYSFSNESQIDLMFRKGNSTYSVSYCPLDDSFGFSE